MQAEHINPILESTQNMFDNMLAVESNKGKVDAKTSHLLAEDITSHVGITGELEGFVYFSMTEDTALAAAGKMAGMEPETFDDIARSAIGELANIIIGQALTNLSNQGYQCDITPPSVTKGENMEISVEDEKFLEIPLHTELGTIQLNVLLRKA
jgi:chemotaxis protein CheX